MALTKRLNLNNGVLLTDPYIKITNIDFDLGSVKRAIISVCIYFNTVTYTSKKPEVVSLKHTCSGKEFDNYFSETILNQSDKNYLSQAYLWLYDKIYKNSETI